MTGSYTDPATARARRPRPAEAPRVAHASLGARAAGRAIDMTLGALPVMIALATFALGGGRGPGATGLLSVVPLLVTGVQAYLIATRSQSVGKMVMNTMIVDREGGPAGLVRGVLLRELPFALLWRLSVPVLIVLDVAFSLRSDRRCLHDHLAGTYVVDCAPREPAP